jgi:Asp-tRNA(Asn)/Glu-tRNA(Gln) amidotransferase B subunit
MSSSLPSTNISEGSDKKVTQFFDKYYTKSLSFPTNDVNEVLGYFEKRGFSNEAAKAVSTVLLSQAKLDEIPVFKLLDTLQGLDELKLSNVVAEILNYNRDRTSSIGYSTLSTLTDKTERRNILV